jgi:hypothetical protein
MAATPPTVHTAADAPMDSDETRGGDFPVATDEDFPWLRLSSRALHILDRERVVFSKPGVYRFRMRKVEMPMVHEIETTGPGWLLTLLVHVR